MDTEIRPGNGDQQRRTGYDRRGQPEEGRSARDWSESEAQRTELQATAGGSAVTAFAAIGAVVLGILSLVGVAPRFLMPIGVISAGVALAGIGAAVAARFAPLLRESHDRRVQTMVGGGVSTETIGGVGVIVLGVLALIGLAPVTLAAVAAIAFGGSLVLGSTSTWELGELGGFEKEHAVRAQEATRAATGSQVLVGLGCVALGILALLGVSSLTLVEISLIAFGGALMLSSAVVGGRVATLLRR